MMIASMIAVELIMICFSALPIGPTGSIRPRLHPAVSTASPAAMLPRRRRRGRGLTAQQQPVMSTSPLPAEFISQRNDAGALWVPSFARPAPSYVLLRSRHKLARARDVERYRFADERLQREFVDRVALMQVNRAPRASVQTRVEEPGRVIERRSAGEGHLH